MLQISLPTMKDIITHVAMNHNDVPMIWGPPGVGKTQGVKQWALEHGAFLIDVRLGQYDSVDIRGIPGVNKDTSLTTWHPPATLPFKGNPNFPTDRPILLFLDELTSATNPVFGVAYQLLDEKRVGEFELMDNVIVVAAGNRDGDRGVTNRMPLPLCNRLVHYDVGVDVDAWINYAQEKSWSPVAIAYVASRRMNLFTFDPKKPDKDYATPRTWEKAIKYYMDDTMPAAVKHASICGAIGNGVGEEFIAFDKIWANMIPLSEIRKNPAKCKLPSEEEASMQYAVAVNISGVMDADKHLSAYHTYLKRLGAEFVTLAWQLAIARTSRGPDGKKVGSPLYGTDEFIEMAREYKLVFAA